MEKYSIIVIILAVAIGLLPVASKVKFPYPVLLLIVGIGVGFIPGFHVVTIHPEVVFLLFLPPMLYDAAYTISFKHFRLNLSIISLLAVTLVFITTTGIAAIVHYCIGMSWPLSFVLGAILSPPDAIAATSVTKGLNLSHRTRTVLEGESLLNDASALVAFRFAVAAVAGSSFVLWKAGIIFLMALGGGFLAGWLLAHIFTFIAKKRLDREVIVSLNLMLPFVAYLLAETAHVSGVIAAVTVGIVMAGHKNVLPASIVAQSKSVLDTIVFILGGLVFILIGLEFPRVLKAIPSEQFLPLVGCAFLVFFIALVIRILIIFWHQIATQRRHARREKISSMEQPDIEFMRMQHRFAFRFHHKSTTNNELLTWNECVIIGWSGMRGIVSLAAALSLPLVMANGDAFPQRDKILFLTVSVVILMLVVQGLGLPILLKLLKTGKPETGAQV